MPGVSGTPQSINKMNCFIVFACLTGNLVHISTHLFIARSLESRSRAQAAGTTMNAADIHTYATYTATS